MAKKKRKLTRAEKLAKQERRNKYEWIFINGKQKRIKREPPSPLNDKDIEEFYRESPHLAMEDGHEWIVGLMMLEEEKTARPVESEASLDLDDIPF